MASMNEERRKIDQIFKDNKKVIKEEIGRVSNEAAPAPVEKPITVMVKVPMDKLAQIKANIEKVNNGKITDITLLATDVVNYLIQRYFSEEHIEAEDFVDLVVSPDNLEGPEDISVR